MNFLFSAGKHLCLWESSVYQIQFIKYRLIQFFNENISIGLTTVPDITIKPTWDPVSLTVKCNLGTYSLKEGKTTTVAQVDFAESYSSLEQVVEDPIGQKFFTYKQDENYIALRDLRLER